jgi:hypothetical protein
MNERCAIVAGTEHIAEQYAEAFNLEGWSIFELGAPIGSRLFDRVVIIRPHWGSGGTQQLVDQCIEHWRTKISQVGTLKVL